MRFCPDATGNSAGPNTGVTGCRRNYSVVVDSDINRLLTVLLLVPIVGMVQMQVLVLFGLLAISLSGLLAIGLVVRTVPPVKLKLFRINPDGSAFHLT